MSRENTHNVKKRAMAFIGSIGQPLCKFLGTHPRLMVDRRIPNDLVLHDFDGRVFQGLFHRGMEVGQGEGQGAKSSVGHKSRHGSWQVVRVFPTKDYSVLLIGKMFDQ